MVKTKFNEGDSFDNKLERNPEVDLPSLDDYEEFDFISAYDFDYWRRNPWAYKDKIDLNNEDFDLIVKEALALMDPETFFYNKDAARASALEMAIWSMEGGKYQSKIHPNTFIEMIERMTEIGPKDSKKFLDKKTSSDDKILAKKLLKVANLLLAFENLKD